MIGSDRYFTPAVRKALEYPTPGGWMPSVDASVIRLHAGYPAPELVPAEALAKATKRIIEMEGDLPLRYTGSPKANLLQEWVEARMASRWRNVYQNETMMTAGSAEAIDIIARTLIDRDTVVAVEAPTYMEALETFLNYTDHVLAVPVDAEGLCTERLEGILFEQKRLGKRLPRFLYTVASFHNPTGMTMSLARRKHLFALSTKYDFLIIEDDAYGELSFAAEPPTTLKSLDNEGRVVYVGSLSKVLAPGIRIGWMSGSPSLIQTFARWKKDLGHPFVSAVVAEYLSKIDFSKHVHHLRRTYLERRQTMLAALSEFMPDNVTWRVPSGGFFVWLDTPGIDTGQMLQKAIAAGVSYVAGQYFYTPSSMSESQTNNAWHVADKFCAQPTSVPGAHSLRLSYSFVSKQHIVDGVEMLSHVIKNA